MDAATLARVRLAAGEAIANALRHGGARGRERPGRLHLALRPGGVRLTVVDRGPGFRPSEVPDPRRPEGLGRSSGRGLRIMAALSDHMRIRSGPRGTVVRLDFERSR